MPAAAKGKNPSPKPKAPTLKERLEKLGLVNDWDFALHLPLRYEDLTAITPFAELQLGKMQQTAGTVVSSSTVRTQRGEQLVAFVEDDAGHRVKLRFIHFFPSVKALLRVGETIRFHGEPRMAFGGGLEFIHPKLQTGTAAFKPLESTLTPVYPAGEGIRQASLRKRIQEALSTLDLTDPLPATMRQELRLPLLKDALQSLHTPEAGADPVALDERTTPAWQRLIFDELIAQQITLMDVRARTKRYHAKRLAPKDALTTPFVKRLPFALTGAQQRVWAEISADLDRTEPMNRLVQGDVGSGKTVIAALAALRAVENGYQAALMAPTEILAEQHYKKLQAWFEPMGLTVVWLSGSLKAKAKREALEKVANGEAHVAVGTHALIQANVDFKHLGTAIVDEQHRFGVAQRLSLRTVREGETLMPHLLMLSATPIPRTLAMSYLADLDVSVIDELPPGRSPIVTKLVRLERKDAIVDLVRQEAKAGRQVYWVCPLVEESEKLDLTPAVQCFEDLKAALPEFELGLVHGQMSAQEKDLVMQGFSENRLQVLVATTVIEVGVDVPNATLMVIEHAERFGLAQLHQLRGRVGRGGSQSACILLFDEPLSEQGRARLKIIREHTDGFEIARHDLELRGPGEFLGERQSGMPLLRFADPGRDEALLDAAKTWAQWWLKTDPTGASAMAQRWFAHKDDFLAA